MIRTAVLGLGNVAEHIHLPACLSVPELKIVAASDPRPERLIKMRDRFKIPALYEDSHELILKEQPDLVIVGTPPDSHKQLTLAALKADADVLCEKPFVLTVEDADEVVEAAKQANRMVAVNTQYRYMNQYRAAAEKIAAGEFGRLFRHTSDVSHPPGEREVEPVIGRGQPVVGRCGRQGGEVWHLEHLACHLSHPTARRKPPASPLS